MIASGLLRKFALALAAVFMTTATTASAQDSTWDQIQERETLRVGVTQAPPWYYKEPGSDEWTGLGPSMGRAMAEELDVEFEPVEVTWGSAVSALQSGKIDMMFVLDATPSRAMAVDFPSRPLLYYALAVLVEEGMDVSTWEDLNTPDTKIAVPQGTTMDRYVSERLTEAEIQRFPSNGEAVAAFQSRRVNAVSLFHPPLISMRKETGRGEIVLPKPIRQSASSVGVRREEDKRFRDWVNTAIAYYYETGQTQEWYEEFLESFGVDPNTVPAIRREEWQQ